MYNQPTPMVEIKFRVRGPEACFTRPEMKVERVSYEVPTPSAMRGVIESILWKPAIFYELRSIAVLKPIRWMSLRRNETLGRQSTNGKPYYVEDNRAQRNTVVLRDVDYIVTAAFGMTAQAGERDNLDKFREMFWYRLEKGQCIQQPYFGCREFPAYPSLAPADYTPIDTDVDRPLGWMLYDFDYRGTPRPLLFEARLTYGVLHIPTWQQVLRENEE